jgi:O-methyltransferase
MPSSETEAEATALYLDLTKRMLTRFGFESDYRPVVGWEGTVSGRMVAALQRLLATRGLQLSRKTSFDPAARTDGRDLPNDAESMIGLKRLDNIQFCVSDVIARGIPGDLIEAGVWRGGASIFMRAILRALGDTGRHVWVADSFRGLPKPDAEHYPADTGDRHWTSRPLAVSLAAVQRNFERYGLLDDRVHFLEGWFKDTLPNAPFERLAVMRLDGDMYESTIDALRALYPKLAVGGYVIIDDYGAVPGCKAATDDFRREHSIVDQIREIDWTGVYWQRTR